MEASPSSTREKLSLDRDFTVNEETGEVTLIETLVMKYVFPGRDFITFKREHDKLLADQQDLVSEERIKGIQESISEITLQVEQLTPFMAQVDEIQRKLYEKRKNTAALGLLNEFLEKKKSLAKEQKRQVVEIYNGLPKEYQEQLSPKKRSKVLRFKTLNK